MGKARSITSECVNSFCTCVPKVRIEMRKLSIILAGKSVDGVWTLPVVQLLEDDVVQAPIIIIDNATQIIW